MSKVWKTSKLVRTSLQVRVKQIPFIWRSNDSHKQRQRCFSFLSAFKLPAPLNFARQQSRMFSWFVDDIFKRFPFKVSRHETRGKNFWNETFANDWIAAISICLESLIECLRWLQLQFQSQVQEIWFRRLFFKAWILEFKNFPSTATKTETKLRSKLKVISGVGCFDVGLSCLEAISC